LNNHYNRQLQITNYSFQCVWQIPLACHQNTISPMCFILKEVAKVASFKEILIYYFVLI